ncbi:MAG TPA: sigma-70 family RNA polymerase sigma factor, partial [Vicinamibacterales bacterium]|nr:sigma-70 family RNA polymerase sigma factor [Vicinamibacterales bacterium]
MTGEAPPRQPGAPAAGLVDHFFRHEYGRLVAILTRKVGIGHLDRVEDAVQSALMAALTSWTADGLPVEPGAWLYRVAHNHLLDGLRRHAGRQRILRGVAESLERASTQPSPHFAREIADDTLRMLFVCCDDGMPRDSQLVFALKTLCGFSVSEIALRLFTSEANVYKRLGRARHRLRSIDDAA